MGIINLQTYFQRRWDLAANIPSDYGVANCRSLIIVQRQANQPTEYFEVTPKPIIKQVSQQLIKAFKGISGIELELDDLQMFVSKTYTRSEIAGRGISYVIDGELRGSGTFGGFEADRVAGTVLRENDLSWELIVRRRAK